MTVKTNVVDYLTQIETLTNTNLQILKTINDSFFTKQNHIMTEVNDTTYIIPSFISLENKINMLQENFENLVNSPASGEAYFNFDGNSRSIEVRKYNYTPDSLTLPVVNSYGVESNNIFKDFMTPVPYINLDIPSLPNDIVEVNVKKIVAKSDAFKQVLKDKLSYTKEELGADGKKIINTYYHNSVNETYSFMNKLLINYVKDIDYTEYDKVYTMPIRKNIGTATYVIESVVDDVINENLDELITLKLRNNLKDGSLTNTLTYKLFDESIEKPLQIGDELVNYEGTGKVVISEIKPLSNTIVVKVVNGEYLNFVGTESYDTDNDNDIHDMSKLRFYDSIDFDVDKYLRVPLEDDQYVFVAVAPLNSRMNIQGSWGTGLIIDAYSLTNQNIMFNEYYKNNVKNIGDVMFELSSMISSPITALTKNDFDTLRSVKPALNNNMFKVMQINTHLNNSDTVKNIRDAYNQKKNAESELTSLQEQIKEITDKLSTITFDDTIGTRNMYVSQLSQLNSKRNSLLATINDSINTITMNVNAAEVPLDNAKYRIRGFYIPDFSDVLSNIDVDKHIIGIKVEYRYKNVSSELGTAVSINSVDNTKTYIYSDWNSFKTPLKSKIAIYNETFDTYNYEYEANNEDKNEPSYNQLDIPISQGETVDIRLKVIYDYGQPYTTMTSDWSNIINIEFPVEFTKDVPILTIVEENNSDIETNRFNGILETNGVTSHINDSIIDQNITFYHKPDSIASGFYTDERRIIPLKDKLVSMTNEIAQIKADLLGANENCKVSIIAGEINNPIYSDRDNTILLESWSSMDDNTTNGIYEKNDNGVISAILNINIANIGSTVLKLYSIFPGNRDILINDSNTKFVDTNDYCETDDNDNKFGVGFKYKVFKGEDTNNTDDGEENVAKLQTMNQFITFRINDVWTGKEYYSSNSDSTTDNIQAISTLTVNDDGTTSVSMPKIANNTAKGMVIYPLIDSEYGLCINSDSTKSYLSINPGEEISIPLYCEYIVKNNNKNESIRKTMSFDLRTSLYNDPINYSFTVVGKNTLTVSDKLLNTNNSNAAKLTSASLKYNYTVK